MLQFIIPIFLVFASPAREYKTKPAAKMRAVTHKQTTINGLTSTQQYQVMCWSVKKWEAYKKNPYYCQAGKRTVGWGFTDVKSVKDVHHADRIFKQKIEECYAQINARFPNFTYMQKSVLVSLLYNTGDMKGIETSGFVKYLERGQKAKAVKRLLMWNKVKDPVTGKHFVSRGLVNRRKFEAKLIEGTFNIEDYNALKKEVTVKYTKGT